LNIILVTQRIPSSRPKERLKKAFAAANRAAAIDPENALAFNALFQVKYHSGHLEDAEKMAAKAIMLNPNDYNMLAYYAVTRAFRGDVKTALSFHNAALELLARPPEWFYTTLLLCAFQNQDYAKVIGMVGDISPNSPVAVQVIVLSSVAHLSMTEEADRFVKIFKDNDPDYGRHILETMEHSYLEENLSKQIIAGLRKAGLDIPKL